MSDSEGGQLSDHLFTTEELSGQTWEECEFHRCSFEGVKHGKAQFVGCTFRECDLSNLDIGGIQFSDVTFSHCKMLGIRWHQAPPLLFSVRFEGCNLSFGDFYGMKLRKLELRGCKLHGVIFEEADLTEANFSESDLEDAVFLRTQLAKADFTDARNYSIDPLANKIRGARFRLPEAVSLLTALGVRIV